ncbi:MAG: bifunctional hydroxymethylpyrimidine kinase/phosphomethylpyrimidine kinase [Acidiferrobacteraceae bacterium]
MGQEDPKPPVVLVFAGLDPSGGAGLAADVQTLVALGCHPAPIATALTVQDTVGVQSFEPVPAALIIEQARTVLKDMPVAAIKTGMLGSMDTVAAVAGICRRYARIPLIVDPVCRSGRGDPLSREPLRDALRSQLLPRALLITPNSEEARHLAPDADTLDACAQELLSLGVQYVLVTGTHEATPEVLNRLYGNYRLLESYHWPRLLGSYHGSGCTLASACAAAIAHGADVLAAVAQAQSFTWNALKHSWSLGLGQRVPNRFFRNAPNDSDR